MADIQQNGKPTVRRDFTNPDTYAATRLPVSEATTIVPDAYLNDEFFALELERLWARSWVCVGYESQVRSPGDMLNATCGNHSVLIVRDKAARLHGYYNVCRHRGCRLVDDEQAHGSVIRCPYHGWGYALDGRLLGTPYFQGMDIPPEAVEHFRIKAEEEGKFDKADYGLFRVRTECWAGLIFVNLSDDACPLSEWLGDLPERFCRHPLSELELVRRKSYSINANWKLVAENFMEYYHLPAVHPELCNISGFSDHHRYQGPGMYTGMCTSPLTVDPDTVKLDLPVFHGIDGVEAQSVYFIMLFPNIALWIFPNHLLTLLFRPDGPGRTLEHMDMLVHPDTCPSPYSDARLDQIMEFWDMVNQQDVKIVEQVQRGLTARPYTGGRMCYEFEEPVHRFQNMVIDRMVGIDRIPPGDDPEEFPMPVAESTIGQRREP